MTDAADDSRGELAAADTVALADPALVCDHLRRAVGVMLEEAPTLPRSFEQALSDKVNQEYIKKFIGDPQTRSLLVERVSNKDEESENQEDDDRDLVQYLISNQVHFTSAKMNSLVLIKRGAVLEAEKPLTSQLLMTTLNEGSPYETLHTLISSAVSPFFKSYVKESGKGDRLSDFLFTAARVAAKADGVEEEIYVRPKMDSAPDNAE